MKLTRSGYHRNHKTVTVISGKDITIKEFDSRNKTVGLNAIDRDPDNPKVTYRYQLSLTPDDIGRLVASLDAQLSGEDRQVVAESLQQHTRALLRLLNLSAGIPMETSPTTSR